MTHEQFCLYVTRFINEIKQLLIEKSCEYSMAGDKFHNFECGARLTIQTREQVLYGFMLKHLISLQDFILHQRNSNHPEKLQEKIKDIVNYCVILSAMIDENRKQTKSEPVTRLTAEEIRNWRYDNNIGNL